MKKILILIFILCNIVYAQVDTLKSYFPLHVGDYWQYKVTHYTSFSGSQVWYAHTEVLQDTLIDSLNQTYYKVNVVYSPYPFLGDSIKYYRYDSLSQSIYEYSPIEKNETIFLKLSAKLSECWNYFGVEVCYTNNDTINIFNQQMICITYGGGLIPNWAYRLTKGIGPAQIGDDQSYGVAVYTSYDLVYAKIDGIQYGSEVTSTDKTVQAPVSFLLFQNYPNPFNPTTTITYSLPKSSFVTLKCYDLLGREITTLVNEEKHSGTYKVKWNAQNVPSGIYFYKITAGKYSKIKKMILLK